MSLRLYSISLLGILAAESFSLFGWSFPATEPFLFFLVVAAALVLTLIRLEYGLLIVLGELFIGSFGYLFWYELPGGTRIPIRLALFLIVLSVWIVQTTRSRSTWKATQTRAEEIVGVLRRWYQRLSASGVWKWYGLLGVAILWGIVWAVVRGNEFENVFLDVNGYLFFALLPVFLSVVRSQEVIVRILTVLAAGITATVAKTLTLLYIFAHQYTELMYVLYRWVRDTRVGEITLLDANFYRIFFQSHIWQLIGFFLFLILAAFAARGGKRWYWILVASSLLVLLVSFSRSFWIGAAAALFLVFLILWRTLRWSPGRLARLAGTLAFIGFLEIGFLYLFVNFPKVSGIPVATLFGERLTETGEAALRSRWELLPVLWQKVSGHPLLGAGFGATVTYKPPSPRVRQETVTGEYTTFSFEWGYLDFWFKMGIAGLVAYLGLLWSLWKEGWRQIKSEKLKSQSEKQSNYTLSAIRYPLTLGFLLGFVGLAVVHFFSPYLNHPLGIGYLLLVTAVLTNRNKKKEAL